MTPALDEADELWSAIADPTRRRILDALLVRGEVTATALVGVVPITRQAITKHLTILERAGLVEGRRSGREVRYRVQPERLDDATRRMSRVAAEWDDRLAAIKRIAEAVEAERTSDEFESAGSSKRAR